MKKTMLSLALFLFSFPVLAARSPSSWSGSTQEITTNFTGASFFSGKLCKDCSSGTNLTAKASYLVYLKENIQVGGEGGIRILSKEFSGSGNSETLLDILAVGAYNFNRDLANSIFAKLGVGFVAVPKDNGGGYENKLGMFIGVGKRFAWLSNVSYTPELRLVKNGDIDLAVSIELLNFSILW